MSPSPSSRRSPFAASLDRAVAALSLALLLTARIAVAEPPSPLVATGSEWWGVVRLGGTPVGAIVERRRPLADGGVETESELSLTLNRAGTRVEMTATTTFREDASGRLRSARQTSRLSEQVTTFLAEVVPGELRVRTGSGGEAPPREQVVPLAFELPGPEAIRRQTLSELRHRGDRIVYRQLVPEVGAVLEMSRELQAEVAPGIGAAARELEERSEGVPGSVRIWIDDQGELVRQREPSPFGEMEVTRASRAEAEAARTGGSLPAEIYSRSLARSNVRLPAPRLAARVRLRLTLLDPRDGWPALPEGAQRVLSRNGARLEIEVTRPEPPSGTTPRAAPTPELAPYLAANAWIESDDPEILRLAREIVAGERDPYRQALRLRDWVHREMRFDLGIVMAPASELVRTRRGTCAGYATLLAALARAAGIPSRYVLGSVYLLGAWGGHAWVELAIGDRWLPFDATLPSPGVADAARLAWARDSLENGLGVAALASLALFGNVQVEVLGGRFDGVERSFDGALAPYEISGKSYRNPGLGLTLRAPSGFTFARADAIWPDDELLELHGPGGARAILREETANGRSDLDATANGRSVLDTTANGRSDLDAAAAALRAEGLEGGDIRRPFGGRPALVRQGARRAGAAWSSGGQVVTLVAEGEGAAELLETLAGALAWSEPVPAP